MAANVPSIDEFDAEIEIIRVRSFHSLLFLFVWFFQMLGEGLLPEIQFFLLDNGTFFVIWHTMKSSAVKKPGETTLVMAFFSYLP